MRVAIVCYEDVSSWILGKLATSLHRELVELGVDARVTRQPDPGADVNHHVIYTAYQFVPGSLHTTMITHVDTHDKVELVKQQTATVAQAICLSSDTVEKLTALGIPREGLSYVNYPSPQSGQLARRKIRVGITSKCYAHGSKREYLLGQLAESLPPGEFEFRIEGGGWDAVVHQLRRCGSDVVYERDFDEQRYRELWRELDYYLYLGQDEGSTGLLDALEAGVPTIATPQGFHLDLEYAISHVVNDLADLQAVFAKLAAEKARLRSAAATLGWPEYARKHLEIWQSLFARRGVARPSTERGRSPWPLPALPTNPGPGGAVHRPRLLVLSAVETASVQRVWDALQGLVPDLPPVAVRALGQEVEQTELLHGCYLEVRVAQLGTFSDRELSTLTLDFDAVVFWNVTPGHVLHRIRRPWKPNFIMRSSWLERLGSNWAEDARLGAEVSTLLFGFVRSLRTRGVTKVVSMIAESPDFGEAPFAPAAVRADWLRNVDLLLHDVPLAGIEGPVDLRTVRVVALDDANAAAAWRSAMAALFELLARPRDPDRPSPVLRGLRGAQTLGGFVRAKLLRQRGL